VDRIKLLADLVARILGLAAEFLDLAAHVADLVAKILDFLPDTPDIGLRGHGFHHEFLERHGVCLGHRRLLAGLGEPLGERQRIKTDCHTHLPYANSPCRNQDGALSSRP
jgi:hypothetical protein